MASIISFSERVERTIPDGQGEEGRLWGEAIDKDVAAMAGGRRLVVGVGCRCQDYCRLAGQGLLSERCDWRKTLVCVLSA